MIDILGFWSMVSLLSATAIILPLMVVVWLASLAITHITQDSKYGKGFIELFYKHEYHEPTRFFTFIKWPFGGDPDLFVIMAAVASIVLWCVIGGAIYDPSLQIAGINPSSPVAFVALVSELSAGFVGPFATLTVAYFLLVPVLRKAFHLYLRVNEVLNTKEKVENND